MLRKGCLFSPAVVCPMSLMLLMCIRKTGLSSDKRLEQKSMSLSMCCIKLSFGRVFSPLQLLIAQPTTESGLYQAFDA